LRTVLVVALLFTSAVFSVGCSGDEGRTDKEASVVVFRRADGRTLTLEELKGVTGTFRYEIVGAANVPAEASVLHERAREAGGRGEYQEAITLLTKASALAPQWPYPVYDRAYTYLLMKDFDAARADYQKTVTLAPRGFFTAITALDILTREQKGEFPLGTYLAYLSLEWVDDRAKRAAMVRHLVNEFPRFAPGWKELAVFADQDSDRLAAIEKGLAAEPDAETRGMLDINKALVLDRQGEDDRAIRLLGELALNSQSTYETEQLAKATLALVATKQ
jgi:tetratricopeptide (TPR) repeat protein